MDGNQAFKDFMARARATHGDKFDASDLAPQFRDSFRDRIEVQMGYGGEPKRGWLGVTTGWKPVFILLHNSRSTGSSEVIGASDKLLRVIRRGPRC